MSLFILASFICFLDTLLTLVIKIVMTRFFAESNKESILRKDLISIKKEMNSMSVVDEFSKYAKLQRKYNKLEAEAKMQINARSISRLKLQLFLKNVAWILNASFTSVLLWLYSKDPIIILPDGYLWPFEQILSWPTGISGGISLPVWIVLIKLTTSSTYTRIKF